MSHDFVDAHTRQAIPYGIYDLAENAGFVNVGTDHNTAGFAARSVEKWWEQMGCVRYPTAKELFITADAGGSNSSRSRLWKLKLQDFADRTGLTIHVSHFPPGTSKWNKIEHRLFSFISINWRGYPLTTYETIVQLIAGTKTSKGLTVKADLDSGKYALGVTISKRAMEALQLERAGFRGEWNYILRPRSAGQREQASKVSPTTNAISHAERRDRWLKIFEQQRSSGLAHEEFCKAAKLKYRSYLAARQKLLGVRRRREGADESRERWLKLFREQAASGLNQRQFCEARGILPNSFSNRRHVLLGPIRRSNHGAE